VLFCSQYLIQSSPEAHIMGATALCCLFQVGSGLGLIAVQEKSLRFSILGEKRRPVLR